MTPKRSFEDALTQPNEPLIAGEGPGEWRWRLRPADPEECRCLAERLRIHPVTARILAARGWSTPALAAGFLNPGWGDILDPTHLPDFDRAISRIIHAIRHGEGIMVIGDYDVDGVTATAILSTAIRLAGGAVTWRIPHRVLDGYGMRDKHVEAARQEGVRLIVTADTGTRSFSAVHCANSAAIDVVVTDHHLPESRLPEAVAVVNPTRCDSAYANRSLCSAGLAFQIAAGLLRALRMPEKRSMALLRSFIKLAAIGTVADVVPLVGENRALVSLGLRALTTVRNPGLRALLDAAGIPAGRMPTGREIAFRLAPRINAAGRIGDASLIMNLLGTADQDEVHRLVRHLEKLNRQRKVEQSRILRGIAGLPRSEFQRTVLVFSHNGWHRGVLGIAAARLVDEHRKPVFVLSEEADWAYGSGRSVPGVNLAALLETTRHHLETFGGHEQAAGLTIRKDRIAAFREDVCAACAEKSPARILEIDSQLHLADAARVWGEIARLEPFGNGNPEPIFATRVRVMTPPILTSTAMCRMNVEQDGRIHQVKDFGGGIFRTTLAPGDRIDLAYRLQRDCWRHDGFCFVLEGVRPFG